MPATRQLFDKLPGARQLERLLQGGSLAALGLVLLMMWSSVAWFAFVYPQRLIEEYRRELVAAAGAASVQTEAVLRDAQSNLRILDLWLLTRPQQAALNDVSLAQLSDTLRDSSQGLVEVVLGDPQAQFYRLPANADRPSAELGDTEVMHLLAHAPAGQVVLGAPLRLRENGPLLLPLAMRLSAGGSEFDRALALVDLQRLVTRLRPFARAETGEVLVMRGDGLGLLKLTDLEHFAGSRPVDDDAGRDLLREHSGTFSVVVDPRERLPRLGAYETLDDFDVKVLVGLQLDAVLGRHVRQRTVLLLACSLITLAALLVTAALNRQRRLMREQAAALQATSNASPLGLFRCDLQGRLIYANETFFRLHELPPGDLGWGWLERLRPETRDITRRDWIHHISQGETLHATRRLLLPSGQSRLVVVRTAPLLIRGRVAGAAGTVADITEQAAQQKAQRTLSAIFDRTPDYVGQFDAQGRLIYLNPSARRRLGLAPTESLEGQGYPRFFGTDALRHFQQETLPAAERLGCWQGRSSLHDADGHDVPADSTVLVHRNARGEVGIVSVILRDLTNELRALREYERSEAMLKAVAEASPTMIWVLDRELRFLFCNRLYEQTVGIERSQWLGRPIRELLGAEVFEQTRAQLERALQGQFAHLERSIGERGGRRQFDSHYAPLRRENGEIEGVICIARDITEAKREEARLRHASQTDPLTLLLNRSGFAQRADEQLAHARQHNSLLTLLYLDLDRFKPVNDQYGHPVGDALLKAVAGRIQHALRAQDQVARLGGDEFAVLLPGLQSQADAEAVAAKLVRVVAQPFMIEAHEISVGVSVGYCVAAGGDADLDRMVALADAQLYEAKKAGRGCHRGGMLEPLAETPPVTPAPTAS